MFTHPPQVKRTRRSGMSSIHCLLEPPHDRYHPAFIRNEAETTWVLIIELRRPGSDNSPIDGVVLRLGELIIPAGAKQG